MCEWIERRQTDSSSQNEQRERWKTNPKTVHIVVNGLFLLGGYSAMAPQKNQNSKKLQHKVSIGYVICLADWCQIRNTQCAQTMVIKQKMWCVCVYVELLMCQKHNTKMPELIEFKPMFLWKCVAFSLSLSLSFADCCWQICSRLIFVRAFASACPSILNSKCFEMLSVSARIRRRSMTISWFSTHCKFVNFFLRFGISEWKKPRWRRFERRRMIVVHRNVLRCND